MMAEGHVANTCHATHPARAALPDFDAMTMHTRPWMRSHGIPGLLAIKMLAPAGLKYEEANVLAEFARWVPDASLHLERLGQLFSVDTLPKLAIALRYNGRWSS